MKTALLERQSAYSVEGVDGLDTDLAERSARLLGYNLLREEGRRLPSPDSLLGFLTKIDVRPFVPASVQRYKATQVRRATFWSRVRGLLLLFLALASIGMFGGAVVSMCLFWVTETFSWSLSLLCVGSGIALFVAFGVLSEKSKTTTAEWKTIPIEKFTRAVPQFALETACQIKEHFSGACLFVDELQVGSVPRDPFLVVELDGTSYHLEVWGEPGFKHGRKV